MGIQCIIKKKPVKIGLGIVGCIVLFTLVAKACGGSKKTDQQQQVDNSGNLDASNSSTDGLQKDSDGNVIVPDGFYINDNDELTSTGDPDMSSEEVLYAYIKGATMLDFDTVQKYSRKSKVVKSYTGYYDDNDYLKAFKRKMYKDALKSMTVTKIEDTALFAEYKCIYTVQFKMLDLTNKDFWKKDKDVLYANLQSYLKAESDSTKAKQYVYDYILQYYESGNATAKDVKIDFVLEKTTDTGAWLVTGDEDLDNYCSYSDGELVYSNIFDSFYDWRDSQGK